MRLSQFADPTSVSRVAIVGAGMIGAGWATQFLVAGLRVLAWDPAEAWQEQFLGYIESALQRLGLAKARQTELLQQVECVESCAAAVANADFVQENGPEDLEAKRELLASLSQLAEPQVIIASSTSGLPMSELQVNCHAPRRVIIGHPFNPVYLMPLVEVVPGKHTSKEAVAWLTRFYQYLGKQVIVCEKEVSGFIANRLQEAVFREALHMVAAGEASVRQIDQAMCYGPGLRWAFMGPFLTYHLAGGQGGIRAFFDNFGDTLRQPYSRLAAPELTEELLAAIIGSCEECYSDCSADSYDEWRDRNLELLTGKLVPRV